MIKKPGVYVEEKNAFPGAVIGVPTAVPAFVGYTETAVLKGKGAVLNHPFRISSLAEYHDCFGKRIKTKFGLKKETWSERMVHTSDNRSLSLLKQEHTEAMLYDAVRLFYANGGETAWIVSVGKYEDIKSDGVELRKLRTGIEQLEKEDEPTMLLIPDAVLLAHDEFADLTKVMLHHCGHTMKNRIALLDVYEGYKGRSDPAEDVIGVFREDVGSEYLGYGASYYPWIKTTVIEDSEIDYENLENRDELIRILKKEVAESAANDDRKQLLNKEIDGIEFYAVGEKITLNDKEHTITHELKQRLTLSKHQALMAVSPMYKKLVRTIREQLNLLPPGPAIAGVITSVDHARGVWKAPANISLSATVAPSVTVTHEEQKDLNSPPDGKAINAIRSFPGQGVLVWGARTLAGNDPESNYINLRRTMIFIEESVKAAVKAYVFEPNDQQTRTTVNGMLTNFLNRLWKQGALAGATPKEAFKVKTGAGESNIREEIQDGVMRIAVFVAIMKPAEFKVIRIEQQMQLC